LFRQLVLQELRLQPQVDLQPEPLELPFVLVRELQVEFLLVGF
jgi:hypothetical protein